MKKNSSKKKSPKSNTTSSSKKKKIDKYEKSKPVQLELFELMNPSEKDYSNTIELYDFIPKYVWRKTDRIQGKGSSIAVVRDIKCVLLRQELKTLMVFQETTSPVNARNMSKTH